MPGLRIVQSLNAEKVPAPNGGYWIASALFGKFHSELGILRNPLYKGLFVWGKETGRTNPQTGQRVSKAAPNEEKERIAVPQLRIVDDEAWEAVQKRLAASRLLGLPRRKGSKHLFSGLAICKCCNSPYTVVDRTHLACSGRVTKRICTNRRRVTRSKFEQFILSMLPEQLSDEQLIGTYVEEYERERKRRVSQPEEHREPIEAQAKELERKMNILMAKLMSPESNGPAHKFIMEEMHQTAERLDHVKPRLKPSPQLVPIALEGAALVARLRSQLANLRENLSGDTANHVAAREAIRGLIGKILISPYGENDDKRGGGPVLIEIEGEWSNLMRLSTDSETRMVLVESGASLQLDQAISNWQISAIFENTRYDPTTNLRHFAATAAIYAALSTTKDSITVSEIALQIIAAKRLEPTPAHLQQVGHGVRKALYSSNQWDGSERQFARPSA